MSDIPLECRGVVLDGPGAEPLLAQRFELAGLLGRRLRGRDDAHLVRNSPRKLGIVLGVELREGLPIAARRKDGPALGGHEPRLDSGDALVQVGDPVRLAHLAVVDDVDPCVDLPPDDLADRVDQRLLVPRRVDRCAVLHRDEVVEQRSRPRKAARMRGEDPVRHDSLPVRATSATGPSALRSLFRS